MSLYSLVQFESTGNDWIIYKHSVTEVNTKSKLIVTTGQIAILVHNGKIESIKEEGSYTLDTELLPYAKSMVKKVFDGKNSYPLEIYYINKRVKLDLLWGTSDPINILDPVYKIQLKIRTRGQLGVKLSDYQYFLQTLVGTLIKDSYVTFSVLQDYFRGAINQRVKKIISSYMINNQITYFEIDAYLDEIQTECQRSITEEFEKFGFDVLNLSIESINVPSEDLERLNDILHKKAEYTQLGDNVYRTTRGYDVLEEGAKNNNLAGAIVGVGLGLDVAKNVNAGGGIIPNNQVDSSHCPNCGSILTKDAKFCPECGQKIALICKKCHKPVTAGQKFCPECGETLNM